MTAGSRDDGVGWPIAWLHQAAAMVDDLPVSPSRLSQRALSRLVVQRNARAASNSIWAGIEAGSVAAPGGLRDEGGHNTFGLDDHEINDRIAEVLTPDPSWVRPARWLAREARVDRMIDIIERAVSPAWLTGGGRPSAADREVCREVGGRLVALAEPGSTWANQGLDLSGEWSTDLRDHGSALLAYAQRDAHLDQQVESEHPDARRALHWVADELANLCQSDKMGSGQ